MNMLLLTFFIPMPFPAQNRHHTIDQVGIEIFLVLSVTLYPLLGVCHPLHSVLVTAGLTAVHYWPVSVLSHSG